MTGRRVRLSRIFRQDGRAAVVALDHGQHKGAVHGLDTLPELLEKVAAGGADAVILNPGPARQCVSAYAGRTALIVRVTGASTEQNPIFDYHRRICSVSEALRLGADAVIAMGFVGGPGEAASLVLLAEVADECARLGVPLVAEMLAADSERFNDIPLISIGARVAYEYGADVVKVYGAGDPSFGEIPRGCPLPVLVAGGAAMDDPVRTARTAIAQGAAGIAFGRVVFGAEDPETLVRSLVGAVHGSQGG